MTRIRIELDRSGGFAGRTTRTAIDTDTLPADQAGEIERLVAGLDLAALAARPAAPPRGNDRFQYDLTIRLGDHPYHLTASEGSLPAELRPLIDRLRTA
jgi:hypothetical protein